MKWDMNRSISDMYNPELAPEQQGEAGHRYVLGLYELLERITQRYPNVLFEGCSGGGGSMPVCCIILRRYGAAMTQMRLSG